jgi:serine/threonine protein kinase
MNEAQQLLEQADELPYAYPVDVWAVGCMAIELATGSNTALNADCSLDLLYRQFRLRGTPTERSWPGIGQIAAAAFSAGSDDWPHWTAKDLATEYPTLGREGTQLLTAMLSLNPAQRITAADALVHPFFDDLDKAALGAAPLPEMNEHPPIFLESFNM